MTIKRIALLFLGIILTLLGLLWFLQGSDIIHLKPLLCFANCEPIVGKSLQWQIIGAITFIVGVLIVSKNITKTNQES